MWRSKVREYWYNRIKQHGKVCVVCCKEGNEVHHIINRRYRGYSEDNLVLLCSACHLLAEQRIIDPWILRYLKEL